MPGPHCIIKAWHVKQPVPIAIARLLRLPAVLTLIKKEAQMYVRTVVIDVAVQFLGWDQAARSHVSASIA